MGDSGAADEAQASEGEFLAVLTISEMDRYLDGKMSDDEAEEIWKERVMS